jgi:hypothetical protein
MSEASVKRILSDNFTRRISSHAFIKYNTALKIDTSRAEELQLLPHGEDSDAFKVDSATRNWLEAEKRIGNVETDEGVQMCYEKMVRICARAGRRCAQRDRTRA